MRIGVICYPTQGGSGVVATSIGQAMAARGHSVHIISYATPFRFQPFLENMHFHEVEVSAYPLFRFPPYDLALANTIMDVVEREGLDLLHAHYAIPHAISCYLARQMLGERCQSVKVLTTLHGTDVTVVGQERGYQRITRFGIEQSDAVTCVSESLARETRELFGPIRRHLEVIPNFVDTERFSDECCPERRATLALPGERIVMHLSNFRSVKRPLDVVEAFAKLPASLNARLIMLGDGPLVRDCKELAHRRGVAKHVRFLGSVDTPWELLPQADVFVLPSEHESFGLAALEAMSCGVPVVASDAGGLPEVVVHGETGLLCPVGDVDALSLAMESVLVDRKRGRELGAAGRARVVREFSKPKLVDRWERYYQAVLNDTVESQYASQSSKAREPNATTACNAVD